jgi:hypothetical protein
VQAIGESAQHLLPPRLCQTPSLLIYELNVPVTSPRRYATRLWLSTTLPQHRIPVTTHSYLLTTDYLLLLTTTYYLLLTTYYYLLLTTYNSLLTTYYSLLTTYYSLLTTYYYYSLLTPYYSLLTTHYLLLTTDYLLTTYHLLLTTSTDHLNETNTLARFCSQQGELSVDTLCGQRPEDT